MTIKPTIDDAIFCAKVRVGKATCMNCRLFDESADTCVEASHLQLEALEKYRESITEPVWKQRLLERFIRRE